jgi:signal transduction histidine kinase
MLPDFRVRQRDYLLEISRSISEELDLETLLKRILNISVEMLAGQAGLIVLREAHEGWTIASTVGIPPAFIRYLDPLLNEVPDHEDPARFELPEINRLLQSVARSASWGLLTGVGLPLVARQKVIGIIFIFRSYPGVFSANDHALLQSFADQAAIAVYNAKLYTLITHEKQRLDALLDTAADGIMILSPGHVIERGNPSLARILSTSLGHIQGEKHENIIQWEGKLNGPTLEQAEADGWPLAPNATLYVEGDLKRHVGKPLAVGITYSALMSTEGSTRRLVNIIATLRDITRFREAEEIKTNFISVISHELKTPIALIKGYVGTLRREDASWDLAVVDDSLAVIEEEADHLTELVENLLDATRLQAGALRMNYCDTSLNTLAKRIADRFRTQSDRHTIVVDFPSDFPVIMGDETRLGQVLSNLISNAIKYSPDGGEIAIRGEIRPDQVIVSVSDQGPGVDPEDVPHVFERFYRSSNSARTTKGTGLGLFLAKAVVDAHGGKIWVDPAPREGALICFSLPRAMKQKI